MADDPQAPMVRCGVCGQEIQPFQPCYEIRYGTVMNGRFEPQESYMIVHSACLKE